MYKQFLVSHESVDTHWQPSLELQAEDNQDQIAPVDHIHVTQLGESMKMSVKICKIKGGGCQDDYSVDLRGHRAHAMLIVMCVDNKALVETGHFGTCGEASH